MFFGSSGFCGDFIIKMIPFAILVVICDGWSGLGWLILFIVIVCLLSMVRYTMYQEGWKPGNSIGGGNNKNGTQPHQSTSIDNNWDNAGKR